MSGEEVRQAGNALLASVANDHGHGFPSLVIAGEELKDCLQAWTKLIFQIIERKVCLLI
ncbi:MAG: hypothetical protein ACOYIB_08910 [Desulfosporosinus sp.]